MHPGHAGHSTKVGEDQSYSDEVPPSLKFLRRAGSETSNLCMEQGQIRENPVYRNEAIRFVIFPGRPQAYGKRFL